MIGKDFWVVLATINKKDMKTQSTIFTPFFHGIGSLIDSCVAPFTEEVEKKKGDEKERKLSVNEAIISVKLPGKQERDFFVSAPLACSGMEKYFKEAIELSLRDKTILSHFIEALSLFEVNNIEPEIFFDNDFFFSDHTDFWPVYLRGEHDSCYVMIRLDEKKGQVWHTSEWRTKRIDFQYEEIDECMDKIWEYVRKKNKIAVA